MTKEDLRIVFFGTPEFAVESLDTLVKAGYDIAAVVTAPDKAAGRGHKMLQSAVKQYAVAHNLPLLQPVSLKATEFVDELRAVGANLFIVIAFRMLPEVVWTMPELGTFNLHASLLPRYRGAAPINWAVINGDKETGVTTFFLKHEIDTGDIISQEAITIGDDECAGSVHDRLMQLGARLTLNTVDDIVAGTVKPMPQDAIADREVSAAPKIFKDTCRIDWTANAATVHNLVRGLSPYPAAWTTMTDEDKGAATDIKIIRTRLDEKDNTHTEPGRIVTDSKTLYVECGQGRVEIIELQPAGKKRMATAEWLRGARPGKAKME